MKLPFFNRKRYIVLKCYTDNKFHVEQCPVVISSKLKTEKHKELERPNQRTFRHCYGSVAGMKLSATMPSWTTFDVEVINNDARYDITDLNNGKTFVEFNHSNDPYYNSKDCWVSKIVNPWMLYEETGVNFVYCKHLKNTTPMAVPSGVVNFKYNHGAHVFNLLHKVPHEYRIPFNIPMMALYPMSDLPLHVEVHLDAAKQKELEIATSTLGYRHGNMLKIIRDNP